MDYILNQLLPLELVEIIMFETHKRNFSPCLSQIKYCVVKIYSQAGYGFISSSNYGYYESLMDDDGDFIEIVNYQLNKKYGESRQIRL